MILFFNENENLNTAQEEQFPNNPTIISSQSLQRQYEELVKSGEMSGNMTKDIGDVIDYTTNVTNEADEEIINKKCKYCGKKCKIVHEQRLSKIICTKCGRYNGSIDYENESYIINEAGDELSALLDSKSEDEIWFSSDWHLLKYKYSKEKVKDNSKLYLENANRLIKDDHIFIYLGDLCQKNTGKEDLKKVMAAFKSINGTKILIKGNHDKQDDEFYYSCGFKYIFDTYQWKNYIFSHQPNSMATYPDNFINIHGHIHENVIYWDCLGNKNVNVFVDRFGGKPINLKYINKNFKELIKVNITSMYPNDRLDDYLKDEINKYSVIVDKYLKKHPEILEMDRKESYKNCFKICQDFIKEVKDPELRTIKGEMVDAKESFHYVNYKATEEDKYAFTVIYNKETMVCIDLTKQFVDKLVFSKAYFDCLKFKIVTIYNENDSVLMKFDNRVVKESTYIINEKKIPKMKCTNKTCDGECAVYLRGEPVYVCKKCGKYCGTVPFSNESASSDYVNGTNRNTEISELDNVSINELEVLDESLKIAVERIIETKDIRAKDDLYPVYIIVSYTNTPMGKLIKTYTHDKYTHAAIAFEPELRQMYSFNGFGNALNGRNGLSCESIEDYIDTYKDSDVQVSVIFLKEKDWDKLRARMDLYLANYKNTSYSFQAIFDLVFGKVKDTRDNLSLICSQFVDSLLKFINVDITGKSSNLVTPGNISRAINAKVYKVFEGKAVEYNAESIKRKINNLLAKSKILPIKEAVVPIYETKEFPVQFDEDGNLLIAKKEKVDFLAEYKKSNKLRPFYVKYNNLEGMKYEAAKLWYINTILVKLLDGDNLSDSNRENYTLWRSKILTEFSLYMEQIGKLDNRFNFTSYYESTPFSDVKIKINGSTIKYTSKYISQFLKQLF